MSRQTRTYVFERNLGAGESEYFDLESPELTDDNGEVPQEVDITSYELVNTSGTNFEVRINSFDSGQLVPSNTIFSDDFSKINRVEIENVGSQSGDVRLQVSNKETQLNVLKDIRRLLKNGK